MAHINLEAVDTDGAIRELAEEVSGDTRLGFLRKAGVAGGAAVGGGAILSALIPSIASAKEVGAPPRTLGPIGGGSVTLGTGDIAILNYALSLEYLERAFYNEATRKGKIHDSKTKTFLKVVTHDERKHVTFLKKALGSKGIPEPKFNFMGTTSDQHTFQQTAYVLENTGVHAYLGQAGNIKTPAYLLAAASIVTIEARHAGAIGSIIGKAINENGAFDSGFSASKVISAVVGTGFITAL